MIHELKFVREIDEVLIHVDQFGVRFIAGWTVDIPKDAALNYVQTYNQNPNAGFFEHSGKVILSHQSAKITLTKQEAVAVTDLIRAAYLG